MQFYISNLTNMSTYEDIPSYDDLLSKTRSQEPYYKKYIVANNAVSNFQLSLNILLILCVFLL
jgi:hypothetical protein